MLILFIFETYLLKCLTFVLAEDCTEGMLFIQFDSTWVL